jgi:hypothetical protein
MLLMLVPFPTAMLAEHIGHPEAQTAAAIYSGMFVIIAILFNVLWLYASHRAASLFADTIARQRRPSLGSTASGLPVFRCVSAWVRERAGYRGTLRIAGCLLRSSLRQGVVAVAHAFVPVFFFLEKNATVGLTRNTG